MPLTVLVNAGPWLPVPPSSYGGVENMLSYLIPELRRLGHRVVLSTVRDSRISVDKYNYSFEEGQLRHIGAPYSDAIGIAHAHMQDVVHTIRTTPDIDVVHDVLEVVGPSMLATLGPDAPPVLHTLQWDLAGHSRFYRRFNGGNRVFFNGISGPQMQRAPDNVRQQSLGVVHNGIDVGDFDFCEDKADYFITLARFAYDKGQDIAARICSELGHRLQMAGTVGGIESPDHLFKELEDPSSPIHGYKDVAYYMGAVRVHESDKITWLGGVGGDQKRRLIARARAMLMPIRWEEPFGMAVIEALASGTPVVAMRRGAMPVLIEHGVNGFLADGEREFAQYLDRVGAIDPLECRRSVERNFSATTMAQGYGALYEEAIDRARNCAFFSPKPKLFG
jgi:glycosyltransferase involved in cell wall biosynthesis